MSTCVCASVCETISGLRIHKWRQLEQPRAVAVRVKVIYLGGARLSPDWAPHYRELTPAFEQSTDFVNTDGKGNDKEVLLGKHCRDLARFF